jgi:hypothetical protein
VKRIIIGLITLFLFAASCEGWRAVPVETAVDQGQKPVAVSGANEQSVISLAKVCFVKDSLISRSMVHIVLSDGKSNWRFEGDDLNSAPYWSTPEVQTLMSGTLTMDFSIETADGAIVSQGRMSWPLEPDRRLSIYLNRGAHAHRCWGCSGSQSFPIVNAKYNASRHDAIFVVWGGNSISHPVHY